jgi:ABC-type multidrug transport system ATPase subunit
MLLRIQNLSKTYPNGTRALDDVSLAIPAGMFGLLGPNGAGKSTLMRIIATLQEPDTGSVFLDDPATGSGQPLDVLRDKEGVRRTLGYLPQEFGLYPKVAADDLLDHFAVLKGITNREQRRRLVSALLEQTNLHRDRSRQLGAFSGGMRQRFGIAVALLGNPRLIIVDEPTAGLDPEERVRFLNLLAELGQNSIVILSTHIVEDVSELCSRVAIIDRGRIRLEDEPQAAVARLRGRVWRRVVGREELARYQGHVSVLSTKLLAGRTILRVEAPEPPDSGFEAAEPELEDVYFAAIHRAHIESGAGALAPDGTDSSPAGVGSAGAP